MVVEKKGNVISKIADLSVQPDWNQTDATKKDFIKNKPSNSSLGMNEMFISLDLSTLSGKKEVNLKDGLSLEFEKPANSTSNPTCNIKWTTTTTKSWAIQGDVIYGNERQRISKGNLSNTSKEQLTNLGTTTGNVPSWHSIIILDVTNKITYKLEIIAHGNGDNKFNWCNIALKKFA